MSPTFDSTLLLEEIDDFIAGYDEESTTPEQATTDVADFGLIARKGGEALCRRRNIAPMVLPEEKA